MMMVFFFLYFPCFLLSFLFVSLFSFHISLSFLFFCFISFSFFVFSFLFFFFALLFSNLLDSDVRMRSDRYYV